MEGMQVVGVGSGIAVIEEVQERRRTGRGLLGNEPLGGPSIEPVARRREHAFRQIGRGIELEERICEIRIAFANRCLVRLRALGRRRREEAQRANLAAVESCEERHLRLLAAIEHIDELARQHAAVDREEWKVLRFRGRVRDRLSVHRAQGRKIARTDLARKPDADRLRGDAAVRVLAQVRRRNHICALRDRFREQAARIGRRHQVHDAEPARGFARNRDVGRIAAERSDVLLNPAQRGDLIEKAVVAGDLAARFRTERRMRKIAEHPHAIVDGDEDDVMVCELRAVIHRLAACAARERAAVNPDEDGQIACACWCPDIEEQTIFARRRQLVRVDADGARVRLHARRAEPRRVASLFPRRHRQRRFPAARSRRRQRVRNAFEHM